VKNPKSQISSSFKKTMKKLEEAEWQKPSEDPEIDIAKAISSHPGFVEKHLKGAPNLAAVRALLGTGKKKE
jgi:hypothetical protein